MILIGQYNDLTILRMTTVGLFLGDEEGEDVLLPSKYCPEEYSLGDVLKVFVYRDHDGKKIATNLEPYLLLHQFVFLKVNSLLVYSLNFSSYFNLIFFFLYLF